MTNLSRLLMALALTIGADAAQAHPHVWVTFKSWIVYGPDGSVTAIRHGWVFDDMFSAYATQGVAAKEKGKFTREELAPLARAKIELLKDSEYFTYVTADGNKVELSEPPKGHYWLEYTNATLVLNFELPLKTPVKAHDLTIDVYDPSIYVDFRFFKDDKNPVNLISAPADCKLTWNVPGGLTFQEQRALAQIPVDQKNTTMMWGAQLANKIKVTCK